MTANGKCVECDVVVGVREPGLLQQPEVPGGWNGEVWICDPCAKKTERRTAGQHIAEFLTPLDPTPRSYVLRAHRTPKTPQLFRDDLRSLGLGKRKRRGFPGHGR